MEENFGIAEGMRSLKSSAKPQNRNPFSNSVIDSFLKAEEAERLRRERQTNIDISQEKEQKPRKGNSPVVNFRCNPELKSKLDKIQAVGVGSKIKKLVEMKDLYEETIKEQVAPLKLLASNFGQMTSSLSNLGDSERGRITVITEQFRTISKLIRYSDKVHGQFLTSEEKERIDKIIRLSRLILENEK